MAPYPSHIVLHILCSTHFIDCFNIQYFLEIFKARKFGLEFFVWCMYFCGFAESHRNIFWVLIFAPIQSFLSLEI